MFLKIFPENIGCYAVRIGNIVGIFVIIVRINLKQPIITCFKNYLNILIQHTILMMVKIRNILYEAASTPFF